MIDLHTHSLLSDGALLPSELARRAEVKGIRVIAMTDHVDYANVHFVVPAMVRACAEPNFGNIRVIPGVEITHVPPEGIAKLALEARALGAKIVVVHGETLAEPVAPGTNRAALESDIDILAHPGLISEEEVRLAARRGIYLEITTRRGHSLTNGHVAALARKAGASLVLDTDTHQPEDLRSWEEAREVALGAGLSEEEVKGMWAHSAELVKSRGKFDLSSD
ncbi:MAG: histidinol phosphate phosphatase domain-containing protein [Candidatus Latescibacteria bacterium]|nr:histidinol phosphate phosphatase domain-containing protein [Candidatus Latescibacterota bacterium]